MTHPGGLFITFEGIDGAGKSTHIAALQERLEAAGRAVVATREPGGTPLAEAVRGLVLNQEMDALTEALLVFAARRDHIVQVLEPALRVGNVVLCDRFVDSSFAYQGGGQGLAIDVLNQLEHWVLAGHGDARPGLRQPDLTLWFDVSPGVALQRLSKSRVPDKFEARELDFFVRVAEGFSRRAAEFPVRFVRIDAAQPPDAVWADVRRVVQRRGWIP